MHANHLPLMRIPHEDGLLPVVNEQVNHANNQEHDQLSSISGALRGFRARISQILHRGTRAPEYTLLLPDGQLLVLCCVKLSQLLCSCIRDDQEKEAVCAP